MRVFEITLKEEKDAFDSILFHLKKSPSVSSPKGSKGQFANDPGGHHKRARKIFHQWATPRLKGYRAGILRSNVGSSRIAFLTFVGLMQKECGIKMTGIFDMRTVKTFRDNADKFSDEYFTQRVEQEIAASDIKVPRGTIDVVKMIENASTGGKHWSSTYATYWDYGGRTDFGIGPGQVEPPTYNNDVKGSVSFGKLEHTTSIKMLTRAMLETIKRKMEIADARAKGKEPTLEEFAKAWNPINFEKAQGIYKDKMMRDNVEVEPNVKDKEPEVIKPKLRPDTQPKIEPKIEPEQEPPGVLDKIGNIFRGYLDSDS